MFELIGGFFSLAFGLVKMGASLIWGGVQFVWGLITGLFSLFVSLGGILLAGALVLVAVFRRKESKGHPYQEDSRASRTYDVDSEEFTSFYDQYRTQG